MTEMKRLAFDELNRNLTNNFQIKFVKSRIFLNAAGTLVSSATVQAVIALLTHRLGAPSFSLHQAHSVINPALHD
jgi:hypothetical protein